ncbi:nitroreductase/quinone reductase family protein [Streptomyces sp. NPDC090080]|uniref:nitroreductase/quinone reductase family protein n=1 Tax=Streptomyces sp. NPDC090080 TaxID=3365939 RepID=UPI0038091667
MSELASKLAKRVGHYRWYAWTARKFWRLDLNVQRLTRGKTTLIGNHNIPRLILLTKGRSTGVTREVPLLCAVTGEGFVVVGSNYGAARHPAWTGNLLAYPHAWIVVGTSKLACRAVLLSGEERERAWRALTQEWPPYKAYAERARRELRVFSLILDDSGDRSDG